MAWLRVELFGWSLTVAKDANPTDETDDADDADDDEQEPPAHTPPDRWPLDSQQMYVGFVDTRLGSSPIPGMSYEWGDDECRTGPRRC